MKGIEVLTDYLTGLPNRYAFEKAISRLLQRRFMAGYALLIDIDDFKTINQGFGYTAGDILIINFALFLQSALPPAYRIFRMNGDVFALISNETSPDKIIEDMEAVLSRCQSAWPIGGRMTFCSVSIAAVAFPANGKSLDEIVRNLNDALYQARKSGKNQLAIYSKDVESVADIVMKRREMEDMLLEAVKGGFEGFQCHYQPIVCAESGRILGAEALLRFTSKSGRIIAPMSFIPLAEQTGLILPIGHYVLSKAFHFCKSVIEAGHQDFHININLSVCQLENPCFAQMVLKMLQELAIPYANIVLEITETMAASNIEGIRNTCKQLLEAGLHIALDDFGTGYSSLNMIRTMPVDGIKIDRTFIKDLLFDEYTLSVIRLITELKSRLGITVYAEGVEQKEQLSKCRELGVNLIQGHVFYKAMPEQELLRIIQDS